MDSIYNVKLTKIESNHQNLRTNEVVGTCHNLPTIGKDFFMLAPPLDPNYSSRMIRTTPVQTLEQTNEKTTWFKTENSTYTLEILE